jgi:hypothetical protein
LAYTLDFLLFFSDKSKLLTDRHRLGCRRGGRSAAVALAMRTFRWEGFGGTGRRREPPRGRRPDGRGRHHRDGLHDRPGA